jgi:uncharacterized membrane protein (UPF0127 family)
MQLRDTIALRALALIAALVAAGCADAGPTAVVHTATGPVPIRLELALTPDQQRTGLMYRTTLAEGHGMLFVFAHDQHHSFWMKNTLIPLDMLFLAADGTILGIRANTAPLSLAPMEIGRPSRHVLEVPGGFTARHGIAVGDRVELRGIP